MCLIIGRRNGLGDGRCFIFIIFIFEGGVYEKQAESLCWFVLFYMVIEKEDNLQLLHTL